MSRNRLAGRIAALEEKLENQGIENGGIVIIWGEDDPDRELKEVKAKRLMNRGVVKVFFNAVDIHCL